MSDSIKNREFLICNLEEAIEQLQETVSELKDEEYEECQLRIDLEHAYHHINYAWNTRRATEQELDKCTKENYAKWSKFPVGEISEYE